MPYFIRIDARKTTRGHAMLKQREIPVSRGQRLLYLGRLVGGIAGGVVSEGLRSLSSGSLPTGSELLLTPGNATRLAERLSEMRGAAMKVGQLLSMEAGDYLPREFSDVLANLRDSAHAMPMLQLAKQLEGAWGPDWTDQFERFFFQPIASASIGQVHKAVDRDGRTLAIKVQYPGIRESIDSDVDNVAALLTMFRLIPEPELLQPLLDEAKRQLHEEADYLLEANHIEAYHRHLNGLPGFRLPNVQQGLNRTNVLVMEHLDGGPIDMLATQGVNLRNTIARRLVDLSLREIFDWGLVQTDANFSNFLFLEDSGDIGLLDFGATRRYSKDTCEQLRRLMAAAIRRDRAALADAAEAVGYIGESDADAYRATTLDLLEIAAEPARADRDYDFGASNLARRMSEHVLQLRLENRMWRMPPPEILFLHRKLGGIYMACARLRARVDVHRLVQPYLST
jgi:predicted unusual protein kinase regulating ubiquinone biosynthesis (AarF/ABC1/UbiB family)